VTGRDRYLLALYIEHHRLSPPIPTGRLAERLDRSPATVTETGKRLESEGLVVREAYEGVTLTEDGTERAERLHEGYVALSWFFREVLELDSYEREAMEMAGLLSPEVTDRLAETLLEDPP